MKNADRPSEPTLRHRRRPLRQSAALRGITLLGIACTPAPRIPPRVSAAAIHRFHIGRLEAVALKDGDIDIANDGKTLGIGHSTAEVGDVLAAAGLPRNPAVVSIQSLLVRDGARLLLFDSGAVNVSWARSGRLPESLALAGVTPAAITDVFVSHAHIDHIGELVTPKGALAFPNATVHISAPEWASAQVTAQKWPETAQAVSGIRPKVVTFEPGARLLPEVLAVATPGHTPGHSSYEISSGGEKLFYLGDVAHHSVVSVQHPEWTIDFDEDARAGEAMRAKVLAALARDQERVYAAHFPFPGIGHVRRRGDSFVWEAER